MNYAQSERAALCELLSQSGPAAPTLCEGWTTRNLAAHLVQRESDLVAAPGNLIKPLSGVTERRLYELSSRTPFPSLVERLKSGPPRFSPFGIPAVDRAANTIEFFVHHEDVRRAGNAPLPPRDLPDAFEEEIARRLKTMGRFLFGKAAVGVVLERDTGETLRVRSGNPVVHVVGRPSELVLFASGRTGAADVEVVGDPDAVAALQAVLGF